MTAMLKKIPIDQLRLGMHVHEVCGSWMDHPFWKSSFRLKSEEQLQQLQKSAVRHVVIDTVKGDDLPATVGDPIVVASAPPCEPLATQAKEVLGIEGSETLVARSRENAKLNGVDANTSFVARNLFEITPQELASYGHADKWLIDPPREGAFALAKAMADLHQDPTLAPGWVPPQRIVYVSCSPSTLARRAATSFCWNSITFNSYIGWYTNQYWFLCIFNGNDLNTLCFIATRISCCPCTN